MFSRTMTDRKEYKLSVIEKDGSTRGVTHYGDMMRAVAGKALWEAKGFICKIEEIITKGFLK